MAETPAPMAPEPSIVNWSDLAPPTATVLDVAAGRGRHALWFAGRGHRVTAVDIDVDALASLARAGHEIVRADLEGAPWPLPDRRFGVVVVVNYLWRPLWPDLLASVEPGGLLMYDTFAVGNERFGRPRNPDFLLRDGELLGAVRDGFEVLDHWHGVREGPTPAVRQRVLARRRHTDS